MKVLLTAVAAMATLSWTSGAGTTIHRNSGTDSVVVELSTTVPGREVEFAILHSGTAGRLDASRIIARGDTVYAWTPAHLSVQSHLLTAPITVTASPGEPWLHARTATADPIEAWGSELRLAPGAQGVRLNASLMKWKSSLSEGVIVTIRPN